jgi:hypothetical protein
VSRRISLSPQIKSKWLKIFQLVYVDYQWWKNFNGFNDVGEVTFFGRAQQSSHLYGFIQDA